MLLIDKLIDAVRRRDLQQTLYLLKYGADPNGRDEKDCFPLLEAAENDDAVLGRILIEAGADPLSYKTIFYFAFKWGSHDFLRLLYERPECREYIDVGRWFESALGKDYGTAIHILPRLDSIPASAYQSAVFEKGPFREALINEVLNSHRRGFPEDLALLLQHAMSATDFELISTLLAEGANPNVVAGDDYCSAMSFWVLQYHQMPNDSWDSVFRRLIAFGGDLNWPHYRSPIACALELRSLSAVEALLSYGVEPNQIDISSQPLKAWLERYFLRDSDREQCLLPLDRELIALKIDAMTIGCPEYMRLPPVEVWIGKSKLLPQNPFGMVPLLKRLSTQKHPVALAVSTMPADLCLALLSHGFRLDEDPNGDEVLDRVIAQDIFDFAECFFDVCLSESQLAKLAGYAERKRNAFLDQQSFVHLRSGDGPKNVTDINREMRISRCAYVIERYKHLGAPSNHDWHHPKDEDCFSARAFESVWRQSVGPSAKKLDCRLQTFLDDIKSGTRRDVNAEPHMYKAWHDEAAKLPESEARDWAMKRLEKLAKDDDVDLKTGQFKAGAQEVTRNVLHDNEDTDVGAAEVRFGEYGGLQLWQDGALVGKLMDSAVSEAMRAGNPVTATIARKGTGYAATVSYTRAEKEMPAYDGDLDLSDFS